MKFGEKLRKARRQAGLSQEEFAKAIGVSLRTITNYETNGVYPKKRELYPKIAEVLGVDVDYLMTEKESADGSAGKSLTTDGIVDDLTSLFASGSMSEDDLDLMMRRITEAYWIAKENSKKYHVKNSHSEENDPPIS